MKKIQFSSFGFSSILLMFVMICIVTFSTLTLITANSDYKLSQKVATKTTSYYEAEKDIYQQLYALDEKCVDTYLNVTTEEEFYRELRLDDTHTVTFTSDINENQYLEAKIAIIYPQDSNSTCHTIQSWQLVNRPMEIEDSGWNLLGE